MQARALRLAVTAAAFATLPAFSMEGVAAPRCELPVPEGNVLGDRARTLERYEQLPPSCLRDIFAACSAASGQALLDPGSAAICSFGYEALLRRDFNGSFPALLAWWQSQRADATR
jgi:hypothetical protein